MKEDIGNLWEYPAEYRCITTNGVLNSRSELIMGAGVALEAKRRFPGLPAKLGKYVYVFGNRPFICPTERIITFPTKQDWRNKSSLVLISLSAQHLLRIADKWNIRSIAIPRPGCGNGGLSWDDVKPILSPLLDDRFVVVSN